MAELTLSAALQQAIQHHQAGRLPEAEALYRAILARDPRCANALHYLGVIALQLGQHDRAVESIRQAAALSPNNPAIHSNLGEAYRQLGRLDEAVASFRQALVLQAESPSTLNNLANALAAQGQLDEAQACCRRALALQPDYANAHNSLGSVLVQRGRFDEAFGCFERAIALKAGFPEAHNNLGETFRARGQPAAARASFQRALALRSNYPEALNNLGNVLSDLGQFEEAMAHLRQALALRPSYPEAHNNLGNVLKEQGRLDEALACFRQAVALKSDFADAHNNLGNVFKEQGRLDEALAAYPQALAFKSDRSDIHSNLILTLQYGCRNDPGTIEAELRRWNQQHAQPLARFISPHPNDRTPDRRLRIGYVSPDFCQHPVGLNLLPLFQQHDRTRFEIFSYAHVRAPDHLTATFRALSDRWHNIVPLADTELAALIRQDQIDLLVDLSLHSAGNRLLTFARKPAPVQVSFAGYPGRTGLAAIDCHLTDPFLDPPVADDDRGPDAPCRLPDTFWCYDPQAAHLAVTPLPALANGRLTFGCLNNFCKINAPVLQLWARVLLAVPDSRLLLLTPDGSHRQGLLHVLASAGLGVDRVTFVDRQSRETYLAYYRRIDLGLDTFPYNGHTTSLDSYWMGVPVVTLVGRTSVGRAGWSQLSNLGLTELATHSDHEFVQIASTLARDLPRLAALRASLRDRMQRSPLMDGPRFARAIEAAYRTMWHRWCAQPAALSGATS